MDDEKPDLVLLDLMLPGADGIELMGDIQETADVPVIFISAYGREEFIVRAFNMERWITSLSPSRHRSLPRESERPCASERCPSRQSPTCWETWLSTTPTAW